MFPHLSTFTELTELMVCCIVTIHKRIIEDCIENTWIENTIFYEHTLFRDLILNFFIVHIQNVFYKKA